MVMVVELNINRAARFTFELTYSEILNSMMFILLNSSK